MVTLLSQRLGFLSFTGIALAAGTTRSTDAAEVWRQQKEEDLEDL